MKVMRTVRHNRMEALILDIEQNDSRAYDMYMAIETLVSCTPEEGCNISGTEFFIMKLEPLPPHWPGIKMVYRFNEHYVDIYDIQYFSEDATACIAS